jgi:hypothetical protein
VTDWTPEIVDDRLCEAASVLRRLPSIRMQGFFSTWPRMAVEFSDLVGQTPEPMRRPPPSAAAITRMEAALPWLQWLEPADAKLVWMRAERAPWKAVCWRLGLARSTAHRRWEYALSVIAWRLQLQRPPSLRMGRDQLVARVRLFGVERDRLADHRRQGPPGAQRPGETPAVRAPAITGSRNALISDTT